MKTKAGRMSAVTVSVDSILLGPGIWAAPKCRLPHLPVAATKRIQANISGFANPLEQISKLLSLSKYTDRCNDA
jgi:hypothetical protein